MHFVDPWLWVQTDAIAPEGLAVNERFSSIFMIDAGGLQVSFFHSRKPWSLIQMIATRFGWGTGGTAYLKLHFWVFSLLEQFWSHFYVKLVILWILRVPRVHVHIQKKEDLMNYVISACCCTHEIMRWQGWISMVSGEEKLWEKKGGRSRCHTAHVGWVLPGY